ncbi:MAG: hypothetical protein ACRDIB_06830, partial [Ardenticatenaceae bacterium]
DQGAAIRRAAASDFDPMNTVVLERAPDPLPQPSSGTELVEVAQFEHQRLVVDVTLEAPAIVVLSEISYPGWVARVNGRQVDPLRAYGLLRAVALPAGQWRVEWAFEPTIVRLGLATSLVTVVLVLLLFRPPSSVPPPSPSAGALP